MSLHINVGGGGRGDDDADDNNGGRFNLKQYGYTRVDRMTDEARRRSLVLACVGAGDMARVDAVLDFCIRVNRRRNATVAAIFESDRDWLRRNADAIRSYIDYGG